MNKLALFLLANSAYALGPRNLQLVNSFGDSVANVAYQIQQLVIPANIDISKATDPQVTSRLTSDIVSLVTGPLLPFTILLGFGFIMAIFFTIAGLLFCCCRCCCNKCGGRRPKKHGYTSYQINAASFFMVLACAGVL
jgi:hypothetical protein